MSLADEARCRELNENADFLPAHFSDSETLPAVRIAGALVFAYVHPQDGLVVAVDLDEIDAELTLDDHTVPMRVDVGIQTVFADPARDDNE